MATLSKSLRNWIIAAAFLILAALGGGLVWWKLARRAPESIEVRARELKLTIVSTGQVMPPAEVHIDSLLTSTVKEIFKREGDTVHTGEVLIGLDDSDIDAARAQALAAIAQARAGRSSLKVTTLPQAKEALVQVQQGLSDARVELERQRFLFQAGLIAVSEFDKALSATKIYESQETAARLQVKAASSGGSASATAAAAIALAEAQLAAVMVNQQHAMVVAPMEGVITGRLVEVGEVVRPGSPLLVLTARGRTRVVLEPDERNLALLAIGQKAAVSAEAYPTESFAAMLVYIAPAVNGDRGTIEVRLDVTSPPAYLRPNMTVSVELEIQSVPDALSVPLSVVQDLGGPSPWLGVLGANGKVEHRNVHLGLRGDELVEIVFGVTAGERVVLEPPLDATTKAPPATATATAPSAPISKHPLARE